MGESNCPYLTNLHYAIMLSVKTDRREIHEVEYLTVELVELVFWHWSSGIFLSKDEKFETAQVAAKLQFRSRELPSHNPDEIVTVFLWRHLDLLPDEVRLSNCVACVRVIGNNLHRQNLCWTRQWAPCSCLRLPGFPLGGDRKSTSGERQLLGELVPFSFSRIYFEQFCPVEGVLYLRNRGSLRRVVLAFPWWGPFVKQEMKSFSLKTN